MVTGPRRRSLVRVLGVALGLVAFSIASGALYADHSWGNYHWARTSNPFTLKLGDNMTANWDPHLATASSDWSQSTVLHTTIVPGQAKGRCRPTSGRVEVCNDTYGNNGWLGLAQIWVSGSHITQGTTKMNDTYFNTAKYNTPAWRQFVVCQEVGHTFGLAHQDEVFNNANLGSCMDYTNDPDGSIYGQLSNEHPNQHDYDQLVTIYTHLDSTTTVGQTTSLNPPAANQISLDRLEDLGTRIGGSGRVEVYMLDFGNVNGVPQRVFSFVIRAQ